MPNIFLPAECRQPDPWDYNTSKEWMNCRKKSVVISAVILAIIVVLVVVVLWLLNKRPWALIALGIGGLIVGGTLLLGRRAEEQKYANMTRDLLTHLRPVNGFPYDDFANQEADLIDIVKYGESIGDDSMDQQIDAAYGEFIKQKQEDKRAAVQAQALASSNRSYYSRSPVIKLF